MYLIKECPGDPRKLEMLVALFLSASQSLTRLFHRCFDCSAFQFQLNQGKPLEDHVFQVRSPPSPALALNLTAAFASADHLP